MDKNNYELMKLTHIGKSLTALGFKANLKKSYATGAKNVQVMNGFEAVGNQRQMLSQAIISSC